MWIASIIRDMKDPDHKWDDQQVLTLRATVFGAAAVCAVVVIMILAPMGYFGPLSSRVRGLFVQHTRTGNPLVDSVAEHQPANAQAYWQFLHYMCIAAPIGYFMSFSQRTPGKIFLILYATVAYTFASKMSRLIILLGPIGSALGGIFVGWAFDFCVAETMDFVKSQNTPQSSSSSESNDAAAASPSSAESNGKKAARRAAAANAGQLKNPLQDTFNAVNKFASAPEMQTGRVIAAAILCVSILSMGSEFFAYSWQMGEAMSGPSLMYKANLGDGTEIIVDDYREAYWWIKKNTKQDARIMAWWDYGYQIAGIANRTSIADGNTWNHEHIATLGRCLTSPEKRAHKIIRHLADYVLVWAGGGGDDLAKSPHMARIGTSVYDDICPNDPTCSRYGFMDDRGTPTPMMEASLLYKLTQHHDPNGSGHWGKPGVQADPKLFKEVFTSKYGKVRVFKVRKVSKESKAWNADPANRVCDAPGSWYCVGQYPPKVQEMFSKWKKRDFAQVEDWNKKRDEKDEEYQREYMRRMGGS